MTNSTETGEGTVVFYHLPKTAGSTLRDQIIRKNYPAEGIVGHGHDTHAFVANFATWPPERLQKIQLLQGHYPFGIHKSFAVRPRLFTVLRDPIERVVSYYFHAKRDRNHYLHRLINDNNWSIGELIESGEALMMNDGQVRLLSAVWGDAPFGQVSERSVSLAIDNLRKMDVVGITESFDQTLLLLQSVLGWQDIFYERKNNVGSNRLATDRLSARDIEIVRRYNVGDTRLYEAGRTLFHDQCKALGPLLPLKVRWIQYTRSNGNLIQDLRRFSLRVYLKELLRRSD